MNKNNFAVVSKNTIDFLSLHDCNCQRIYFKDNQLVFEMDWLEVLSTHPDNPYDKAHQSDQGQIILYNPIKKELDFPDQREWAEYASLLSIKQFDFKDCTMLQFDETPTDTGYSSYILFFNESHPFIEMTIGYSESLVMWNQLREESWFEDEKWKK